MFGKGISLLFISKNSSENSSSSSNVKCLIHQVNFLTNIALLESACDVHMSRIARPSIL